MAVTGHFYDNFFTSLGAKQINLASDTFKAILLGTGYTPNQGTHRYQSDLGANEITGTGYTAGGQTISPVTPAVNTGTHVFNLTGSNPSWPSSSLSARYMAIVDTTPGSAATNPLVCFIDFGGTETTVNGTFSVTWDATGIGYVTVN
jgi:hypothetical protein